MALRILPIGLAFLTRLRLALSLCLLLGFAFSPTILAAQTSDQPWPNVPSQYLRFFKKASSGRALPSSLLSEHGITDQQVGRSYALIAGISHYNKLTADMQALPPAKVDVDALLDFLEKNEYFDEIVMLEDNDVTLENLNYFLGVYFPNKLATEGNDRFLFAYSGHGFDSDDGSYLLTSSAEAMDDRVHSIDLAQLKVAVEKSASKALNALVLINSCQAGSFLSIPFGDYRLTIPKRGAHAITAGARGQLTYASTGTGRGSYFFEEVLRGLKGNADSKGAGLITTDQLYTYVRREVERDTENTQDPQMGDIEPHGSLGSFFFLRALGDPGEPSVSMATRDTADCFIALETDNFTYALQHNFQEDFLRSIDEQDWRKLQSAGHDSPLFADGKSFLGADYSLADDYGAFDRKRQAHLKSLNYSRSYDQASNMLGETSATRDYPNLTACMEKSKGSSPTLLIWPSHEDLSMITLNVRYAGPADAKIVANGELSGGNVLGAPSGRLFAGTLELALSSPQRTFTVMRDANASLTSVAIISTDNSIRVDRTFRRADALLTTVYSGNAELPGSVTRRFNVRTPDNNENRGHCPNEVGHHDGKYCTSRTRLQLTTTAPHFFKSARIDCVGGGCPWGATGPVAISPDGLTVTSWVDNWGSPFDATLTAEEFTHMDAEACGPDTAVAIMKDKPVLIGVQKDCAPLAKIKWLLIPDLSEGIFNFGDKQSPGGEIVMNGSVVQSEDSAVASYTLKK